jgi:superfamily II DNA or RNA helicase
LIVDSLISVRFDELTASQSKRLEKELTFVSDAGEVVTSYIKRYTRGDYVLPRGAWFLLPDSIRYIDRRSCPEIPMFNFTVKLDDVEKDARFAGQSEAVAEMFEQEQGLIVRPPGTGKTQIALAFAAACQTRTLVLVHTEDILEQWTEYAENSIEGADIGIIRGKRVEIGDVTIATVQTLHRMIDRGTPKKFWRQFGCVFADEAHHVSAPTWEAVLNTLPARYRFGFTASPTRADGLERTMRYIVGPVIHRQKFSSPVDLKVVPVRTKFNFRYRGPFDWQPLLKAVISSDYRNGLIARKVDREIARGNSVLVLSRRIEHLERIAEAMQSDSKMLTGHKTSAVRKTTIRDFRTGEIRCLLATQLADEALDVPRLNRVFLVHPGKAEGRLVQQVGRAIREHPEKSDAKIYDFVDRKVGVLRKQWDTRKRVYRKNGISIHKRRLKRGA